jgi:hypothetical protein
MSMIFLCLVMFKINSLTEMREVTDVMSSEQLYDFEVRPVWSGIVLLTSAIASQVLCLGLLLQELQREHDRAQVEERAAKARRLRRTCDDLEVHAPVIRHKGQSSELSRAELSRASLDVSTLQFFHLFLSQYDAHRGLECTRVWAAPNAECGVAG